MNLVSSDLCGTAGASVEVGLEQDCAGFGSVGSRQNMSFFWYFSFVHVKIPINTYLTKLLVLWREPFFSRGEIVEYVSFHNRDHFLMGPCSEICD